MHNNLDKEFYEYHFSKIIVIGCPGSGKSTLSQKLSKILNIELFHLDKVYWKPNWENISKEEFDKKLDELLSYKQWIIDGNYNRTLKKRIDKCQLIIYLDYSSRLCLESYYKRVSDKSIQGFITDGCVEELDEEFVKYIKDYNDLYRDTNYDLIYESAKKYLIFTNRDELNDFLLKIKG